MGRSWGTQGARGSRLAVPTSAPSCFLLHREDGKLAGDTSRPKITKPQSQVLRLGELPLSLPAGLRGPRRNMMFLVLWVFKVEKSSREWSTRQTEGPLSCLAPLKPQQTRSPSGSRVQGFCVSQLPIRFPFGSETGRECVRNTEFFPSPSFGEKFICILHSATKRIPVCFHVEHFTAFTSEQK